MSDTPRTDEQINGKPCTRFEILAGDSLRNASVPSEFARTLERELAAANERIKQLEAKNLSAQKQKQIVDKLIESISIDEPRSQKIDDLLNQHFWGLV